MAWQHALVGQSILAGTPFEAHDQGRHRRDVGRGRRRLAVRRRTRRTTWSSCTRRSRRSPTLWWRSVGHTHTALRDGDADRRAGARGRAGSARVPARAAREAPAPPRRRSSSPRRRRAGARRCRAGRAAASRCTSRSAATSRRWPRSRSTAARIRVHRVVCAVDCGIGGEPAGVEAQVEGGDRLRPRPPRSTARSRSRTAACSRRTSTTTRSLRMHEMPTVEVHIVPSTEKPGGVGEPACRPIAPAVANAVFAAHRQAPARAAAARSPEEDAMKRTPARDRIARSARPRGARRAADRAPAPTRPAWPRSRPCARCSSTRAARTATSPATRRCRSTTAAPHGQNVLRGPDGHGAPGLPCATCHGADEPARAATARTCRPGAPNWHLPPPEHEDGVHRPRRRRSCARTIKDPKRDGGKDLAALLEHVADDKLVLWGWDPGVGRAPVAVPHAEFVAAFRDVDGRGRALSDALTPSSSTALQRAPRLR